MFKKKILSLLLISILVISSIGFSNGSNKIKIHFDDRGEGYYNYVTIYPEDGNPNGYWIYKGKKTVYELSDRTFTIPKEKFRNAKYMDISNGFDDCVVRCTHHITLSDEFKQNIPDKITFVSRYKNHVEIETDLSGDKYRIQHIDLYLTLWNHHCESHSKRNRDILGDNYPFDNNTIEYTFKKWS